MALSMGWAVAAGLSAALGVWSGQLYLLLAALAILVAHYWGWLSVIVRTMPRDLRFVYRAVIGYSVVKRLEKRNACIADVFDDQLRAHPHKVLIKFNDQDWTFQQVADYSNRVANTFERAGYKKGDVVALVLNNCPEYVCIWLGLSKLGVISALINHNQRGKALVHSLSVADCRAIIFGADFAEAVLDVKGEVGDGVKEFLQVHSSGDTSSASAAPAGVKDMNILLADAPTTEPKSPRPGYKDVLLYIYTSGTTGLPKAAKIIQSRYVAAGAGIPILVGLTPDDVVYCPLPLYHSAGGMCAMGYGLVGGMTVILRTKFSASAFIPDCIKYKCTVVQYIGEVCRYVLAAAPRPTDTQHGIRVMIGNGLRPPVWQHFVDRFRVGHVAELYGSTEGNVTFFNFDNTVGAVGFLPRLFPRSVYPIGFIRVEQDTGDVIRNKDGLCERCDIDEPGMLVGYISESDPSREFHGYVDNSASQKKIIRDVYKKGDKWFMTGDILVMDKCGYIYFRDRTGDTFRWKGENVSTAEVETAVTGAVGERDISVYGVQVEGAEGRAGMAAIADPDGTLDLDALARGVDAHLPSYARPLFVRVAPKLEKTGTYKIIKVNMQKQGYDPSVIADPLFIRQGKGFVPLTATLYQDITSGKLRL